MKRYVKVALTTSLAVLVALAFSLQGARSAEADFGSSLEGLTPEQEALFEIGREDFAEVEEVADGLGPLFNARGCGECHVVPVMGGSGFMNEVRAGYYEDGKYLDLPGGSLFQLFSTDPRCQESVPLEADVLAFRQSTPLFGMGLIEAIPDDTILSHADPEDLDLDGIAGRAHLVEDVATARTRVGRFGWKAQQATLLSFSADAYLNEMGITSELARDENIPNGNSAWMADCDKVPDPEDRLDAATGRRAIDNFTNFMRMLAPPPRGAITDEAGRGEGVFARIGCAQCHIPSMRTGESPIAALSGKAVPLYSDLLLHDVGTGDGIVQGGAQGRQLRTPPLWGLRSSAPYLHDGSAPNIEQAILRHRSEALLSITRLRRLNESERKELLAFLYSL